MDFFKSLPLLGIFTKDLSDRLERSSNQIWIQLEAGGIAWLNGGQDLIPKRSQEKESEDSKIHWNGD